MAWAPDYVTTAELRSYLTIGDPDDDTELDLAIAAASRAVDRHCNRQFGQVASAELRLYTARWERRRNRWVVEVDDVDDDTGLTITVDGGTVDSYDLEPINAAARGRPWTQIAVKSDSAAKPNGDEHEVNVTALWGWTTTPDPVKQATLLQASRLFNRRTSPYGVAGSPDLGSEMRLLAKVDPDVAVSLGPFVRWWGAA